MISGRAFLLLVFACAGLTAKTFAAVPPHPASAHKTNMRQGEPVKTAQSITDTLQFGSIASEQAHGLTANLSDTIVGGLGEPARRLLPQNPASWEGGRLAFTLKIDPAKPNYITARLWGSDVSSNRLKLFCEGRQIGYHHLGDVDLLDFGTDGDSPGYNGRFFYNTSPIPFSLTQGKTELHCEIRSMGRIWGYGNTFAEYQKPMTEPTRGIYSLYAHTEGYFTPLAGEKQGMPPVNPPVRQSPGPEVLEQVKARVNDEISRLLKQATPLNQMQTQFLAKAWHIQWTRAYRNPQVAPQVEKGLDALFITYRKNPKLAEAEPSTYNPDWFGLGPAGDTIRLLAALLRPSLDTTISDGAGAMLTRRAAWSEMLQASRDWHRKNRRQYTNQSMIVDMYIYAANKGVAAIDPAHALPDAQMRHYLYQSVGLEPWLGSDTDHGPEKPLGEHYYELTTKGLTRELGFVGYYGEVLDWVAQLYDVTREPGQEGDARIKAQLAKIIHARAPFRYPMLDAEGNRAMRIETIVGWRDAHYPGDIVYGERPAWDGSALYALAATLDPLSVGSAQQMFADNQFFASLQDSMKTGGLRITAGLLGVPDEYEKLKAQLPSPVRLPMTPGQPDFAFADEEDGVVAIKNGNDILYVSLYWRARYAINNLARIHYITPRFDRIAVVRQAAQFTPSGMAYTVPDWVDLGFAGYNHGYPADLHQAMAGEKQPIAKIPEGVKFKPGEENSYAGKAEFYALRYGDYLIGMNCTESKTFPLTVPAGFGKSMDLVSRKILTAAGGDVVVKPMSTVVLYTGKALTPAPLPKKPGRGETGVTEDGTKQLQGKRVGSVSAPYDFSPVTAQIQEWVDKGYYPGAGLIVARDGTTVYEQYFGSYKPDTVAYIASAGKWLAAAAIASVVDAGKLSWDDPVTKWLPQFTDARGRATLRQLLSHTSGFPDYQPQGNPPDHYQTLTEAVAHIVPLPPDDPPGTRFHYGGLAMQIAGRMAELATGKDWEALFQERIARPCRMTNTHFTPVDPTGGHNPMLGGGARCALRDYGNFLDMIAHDGVFKGKRVLSAKAVQEMQADQARGAKVEAGAEYVEKARGEKHNGVYGLGEWREKLNAQGQAILLSSPSWAGAYPWIDKTHHIYGFFLAHVDTASPSVQRDRFNAFYSSPVLPLLIGQILDAAAH